MLKCCGCQTNFILSLGGSFLFSKNFLSTPSLTGGLVRPIRRTKKDPCIRYISNTWVFYYSSIYIYISVYIFIYSTLKYLYIFIYYILEFMCKTCIHTPVCLEITRQTCGNVSKYAIIAIKAITTAESKFSPSTFKVLLC